MLGSGFLKKTSQERKIQPPSSDRGAFFMCGGEMADDLDDLREQINRIDSELVCLLRRRMELSSRIGRLKSETGMPVVDEARENQILSAVLDCPDPNVNAQELTGLFQHIIDISRKIQIRQSRQKGIEG
jgi:chorismate mutase